MEAAAASPAAAATAASPQLCIDHLVYVVPSLEEGMAAFEELTGVRPCIGGRHEGLGTHNALVSLGDGIYLEILAKDPSQQKAEGARWLGVDGPSPRLTTFCARPIEAAAKGGLGSGGGGAGSDDVVTSLEGVSDAARELALYDVGPLEPMTRRTPEGKLLRWRLAAGNHHQGHDLMPGGGLVPFLIDWSQNEMPHPSQTSPSGCSFVRLSARHPDPPSVERVVSALGAWCCFHPAAEGEAGAPSAHVVAKGDTPVLEAVIQTPKGMVTLS